MSNDDNNTDASAIEPRTQRALTEDMDVALRHAGGIYSVRGESGNTYPVDISRTECSCPDQQKPNVQRCKHIRRVDMEIRNRTVPTPDGRLPDRPVADGGVGAESETFGRSDSNETIEGPIREFDKDGQPTGFVYYRCSSCGQEAMRRQDLADCCPV